MADLFEGMLDKGPIYDFTPTMPIVLDIRAVHAMRRKQTNVEVATGTQTSSYVFTSVVAATKFLLFLSEAKKLHQDAFADQLNINDYFATKLEEHKSQLAKQQEQFEESLNKSITRAVGISSKAFAETISKAQTKASVELSTHMSNARADFSEKLNVATKQLDSLMDDISTLNSFLINLREHPFED